MDELRMSLDTAQLLDQYRELLLEVDALPLRVSGNSMAPFLVHNRDTVYLSKIVRPLKVGDIVLYQRRNGTYILHRICKINGDYYYMVGDAQAALEYDIKREQIFGIVCKVERKGKDQKPGCFWWEFFEKIWVRMIPYRPTVTRIYSTLRKYFER